MQRISLQFYAVAAGVFPQVWIVSFYYVSNAARTKPDSSVEAVELDVVDRFEVCLMVHPAQALSNCWYLNSIADVMSA